MRDRHASRNWRPLAPVLLAAFLQATLPPSACRASDAEEPRTWRDVSGQFEVEATLVEDKGDEVRLRTTDGRELTVPTAKLGVVDRKYLRRRREGRPETPPAEKQPKSAEDDAKPATGRRGPAPSAPPGILPVLREADAGEAVTQTVDLRCEAPPNDLFSYPADTTLVADPRPRSKRLGLRNATLGTADYSEKRHRIVPCDPDAGTFLASLHRPGADGGSRVFLVDLTKQTATLVHSQRGVLRVVDHDAGSGRSLLLEGVDVSGHPEKLAVWEGLATGKPKRLFSRGVPAGVAGDEGWFRFVSPAHVAGVIGNAVRVWDIQSAKEVHALGASRVGIPALSGSRLLVAVPIEGLLVVADTATGTIRASIDTGLPPKATAAFDPSGTRVAVCSGSQCHVYDCIAGTMLASFTSPADLGPGILDWISPGLVLTANGSVIDVDLGTVVWRYRFASDRAPVVISGGVVMATTSGSGPDVVSSVPLLHAAAEKEVKAIAKLGDDAMAVRAGSTVAVHVEAIAGVDPARVRAAVEEAVKRAGWRVAEGSPISVVARVGRGATVQSQFRISSFGQGLSQSTETLSMTPYTASLDVFRGQQPLWNRATVNRIPSFLSFRGSGTAQDEVRKAEVPDYGFFESLQLPRSILRPEVASAVKTSTWVNGKWVDGDR